MKKLSLTTLSLVALLAAGTAFAADDKPLPPKGGEHGMGMMMKDGEHHDKMRGHMFKENDTNNDGAISKEEWVAKGDKMFKEIDANGDGKISQDEMKAHHEKKRAEWKERREERKENVEEHKEKLKEKLSVKDRPLDKQPPINPKDAHEKH